MKRRAGGWRLEAGGQSAQSRVSDFWLVLKQYDAWKSVAGRYTRSVAPLRFDLQPPVASLQPRTEIMP